MQTSIRFLSLVVMAMLVTVLSVPGHAHPGGGKGSEKSFRGIELTETERESWRERRFERLSERLELESAQMDAVREILGEARATLHERHQTLADSGQDRAEIRAALRAEREEMRSEIRERLAAVLTPEQLETFETMRRDGERRKGKRQLRQRDRS